MQAAKIGTVTHGLAIAALQLRGRAWTFLLAVLVGFTLSSTTAVAQMFAGYNQFCGVPVIVLANPQSASAARDPLGNPVIYVDPGVMNNWTMSRMFALAHECAHHMLGHTMPQGMWFRNTQVWATRQQELEADCWAAQRLAEIRDTDSLRRMIMQFASQGPVSYGPYPTGQDRALAVARCAGLDLRSTVPAPYCCDAFGNRRCVVQVSPGPPGSPCACMGQGWGVACN
jgi:hypothetical protein